MERQFQRATAHSVQWANMDYLHMALAVSLKSQGALNVRQDATVALQVQGLLESVSFALVAVRRPVREGQVFALLVK